MISTLPDQVAMLERDLPDKPVCEGESGVCVGGGGWYMKVVSVCGMRGVL